MPIIPCDLDDFTIDSEDSEGVLNYARAIVEYFKIKLNALKPQLDDSITKSAAFSALEQNLAEYVHNSIDSFRKNNKLKDKIIILEIPQTPSFERTITLVYYDNAGGFSKDFIKGDKPVDFYQDKLKDHKLSIFSAKKTESELYLGGAGFALAQTSRFLHKHNGSLTIQNAAQGAKLKLISPVSETQVVKPSFHRFAAHIDIQDLAKSAIVSIDDPISPRSSYEIPQSPQKSSGLKIRI